MENQLERNAEHEIETGDYVGVYTASKVCSRTLCLVAFMSTGPLISALLGQHKDLHRNIVAVLQRYQVEGRTVVLEVLPLSLFFGCSSGDPNIDS